MFLLIQNLKTKFLSIKFVAATWYGKLALYFFQIYWLIVSTHFLLKNANLVSFL